MSHTHIRQKLAQMGEQDKVREIILNVYNEEITRELPLYRNVWKITIPETCEDYEDYDKPMGDLSCLEGLQKLEILEVFRKDVADGSALGRCPSLRVLRIDEDVAKIWDLNALRRSYPELNILIY